MSTFSLDPSSETFLAHWKSVRGERPVPRLADFLDRPSAIHAPFVYVMEVAEGNPRMRLQGTSLVERWGKDFTGLTIYTTKDETFRRRSFNNYRLITGRPCGCLMLDEMMTSRGRLSQASTLVLPLEGRPEAPLVVVYSHEIQSRHAHPLRPLQSRSVQAVWIDVGAGVPATAPELPTEV